MHYVGTLLTSLQLVQRPAAADCRPLSLAAFLLSRAHPSPSTAGRCCRPFPQINPIIPWPHRHPSPSHQPSIPSIPAIRSTARKLAAPVPESLRPPILLIGTASIASLGPWVHSLGCLTFLPLSIPSCEQSMASSSRSNSQGSCALDPTPKAAVRLHRRTTPPTRWPSRLSARTTITWRSYRTRSGHPRNNFALRSPSARIKPLGMKQSCRKRSSATLAS